MFRKASVRLETSFKKEGRGQKTVRKRIQMLNQKREEMLKEIHCKEGQLDCLDYLRYELQKQTT